MSTVAERAELAAADRAYEVACRRWRDALVVARAAHRELTLAQAAMDSTRQDVDLALTALRQAEARPLVADS
jgi:hypothetical protein